MENTVVGASTWAFKEIKAMLVHQHGYGREKTLCIESLSAYTWIWLSKRKVNRQPSSLWMIGVKEGYQKWSICLTRYEVEFKPHESTSSKKLFDGVRYPS